jgi:hypothetical protein
MFYDVVSTGSYGKVQSGLRKRKASWRKIFKHFMDLLAANDSSVKSLMECCLHITIMDIIPPTCQGCKRWTYSTNVAFSERSRAALCNSRWLHQPFQIPPRAILASQEDC